MVFLPRTDLGAQERCRVIVEREILAYGYTIHGWRQVPVNVEVIGEKANATRRDRADHDRQQHGTTEEQFEVDLYVIRRRIEKAAMEESIKDLYICSMSCRSVIYKGMFLAEQLTPSIPTCWTSASFPTSRSGTSAIRPTPSRPGTCAALPRHRP